MQNLRENLSGTNVIDCLIHFYDINQKKNYQGWLNKLKYQEFDVKMDKDIDISIGEKFFFELITLDREIKFEAITQIILKDILRFSIISSIKVSATYKTVQKRVSKMPVKIKLKNYYFNANVIRISPNSLQLISEDDFEVGDKLNLNILTSYGIIDVDALVMSCNIYSCNENNYILSLEFLNIRRTTKIRWLKYFLDDEYILAKG